ncbi:MAG TPA: helix-turn-helix domain-containing protein [Thermomicrobiales bacterium]|nr:helix-turn-helix domain-containing protein [Thermomicrobiales bacterium]
MAIEQVSRGWDRATSPDATGVSAESTPSGRISSGFGDRQRIGASIRRRRNERGMPLGDVAQRIGISTSHLSRIERGLTIPSYKLLGRIADDFGIEPSDLLAEERATVVVDDMLEQILEQVGMGAEARRDLLRLGNDTRAELASAMMKLTEQNS